MDGWMGCWLLECSERQFGKPWTSPLNGRRRIRSSRSNSSSQDFQLASWRPRPGQWLALVVKVFCFYMQMRRITWDVVIQQLITWHASTARSPGRWSHFMVVAVKPFIYGSVCVILESSVSYAPSVNWRPARQSGSHKSASQRVNERQRISCAWRTQSNCLSDHSVICRMSSLRCSLRI